MNLRDIVESFIRNYLDHVYHTDSELYEDVKTLSMLVKNTYLKNKKK